MADHELGIAIQDDSIRTIPIRYNSHVFFLDEDLGEPVQYRDITQLLITCSPDDVVSIIINSSGGRLDSACQIIEAIESCQGSVVATVVGAAYSAASMIACIVPECNVTDSAEFMIHTASYGTLGNTANVKAHTDFVTEQVHKLLDKVYRDFMTPEEIEDLKAGKEFWFGAEEARKRFKRREQKRAESVKLKAVKAATQKKNKAKAKLVKEPTE